MARRLRAASSTRTVALRRPVAVLTLCSLLIVGFSLVSTTTGAGAASPANLAPTSTTRPTTTVDRCQTTTGRTTTTLNCYGPTASFTISPPTQRQGKSVFLSGSGCAPNQTVTFKRGSTPIGSVQANSFGKFAFTYTIPFSLPIGPYTLSATCGSLVQTATLQVTSRYSFIITPSTQAQGKVVVLSGTGCAPNRRVSFTRGSTAIGKVTANAAGDFSFNYTIPVSLAPGSYTITATCKTINQTATLQVIPKNAFTVTPSTQERGKSVTLAGRGCAANATVTFKLGNTGPVIATTTANSGGQFTKAYAIPISQNTGTYSVKAICGSLKQAATLKIVPQGTLAIQNTSFNAPKGQSAGTSTVVKVTVLLLLGAGALVLTSTKRRRRSA